MKTLDRVSTRRKAERRIVWSVETTEDGNLLLETRRNDGKGMRCFLLALDGVWTCLRKDMQIYVAQRMAKPYDVFMVIW